MLLMPQLSVAVKVEEAVVEVEGSNPVSGILYVQALWSTDTCTVSFWSVMIGFIVSITDTVTVAVLSLFCPSMAVKVTVTGAPTSAQLKVLGDNET
jgi:hypothetical protein